MLTYLIKNKKDVICIYKIVSNFLIHNIYLRVIFHKTHLSSLYNVF